MQAVSRWLWQVYMLKSDEGAYITLPVHIPGHNVEQHYSTLKTASKTRQLD